MTLFWPPSRGLSHRYLPVSPSDTLHRSGSLSRGLLKGGGTIIRRLKNLGGVLLRAFALRGPLSYYMSDRRNLHFLPFRSNINRFHGKAYRNVPYLRQSWTRIDFIAIVSFWITFRLAMSGIERGRFHIGIFRALSVIRTIRLLTITSGTAVRLLLPNRVIDTTCLIGCHAFSQIRTSAAYTSRLFCHLRYRAFLVRSFLRRHSSHFIKHASQHNRCPVFRRIPTAELYAQPDPRRTSNPIITVLWWLRRPSHPCSNRISITRWN